MSYPPPILQPTLPLEVHKRAWAKFNRKDESWMPLHRHLDDAACTAALLWDSWLPANDRRVIAACLGNDEQLARKVAILVAAGHDIGKHSIPFAIKAEPRKVEMEQAGADFLTPGFSKDDLKKSPHSHYSALSYRDWLTAKVEPTFAAVEAIQAILAGHHGAFPAKLEIDSPSNYSREEYLHWHAERLAMWDRASATAGLTEADLITLATKPLSQPAQMVLTGFLIMSDWIASNQTFFPLTDARTSQERAQDAINRLRFPRKWQPAADLDNQERFATSFSLPAGATARPVQQTTMEIVQSVNGPSLLLIEAPTGEGKTEAALVAAEILAARFGLSGVTMALPTCATADAMLPRLLAWLDNRLPEELHSSVVLSHGKAQFNEEYQSLFRQIDDDFGEIYDDDSVGTTPQQHGVQPHWWFTGRKTGTLSDFTIGTIDQVLFGALRSKHLALRHLGFASKVIILDEIHAADAYMSVYLDRIITWLGALGVPVVALSATLDPDRRAKMLQAYRSGAAHAASTSYRSREQKADAEKVKSQTSYPLISVANATGMESHPLAPSGRKQVFSIDFTGYNATDLVNAVIAKAQFGGCIAVVCNTVRRAQDMYDQIRSLVDADTEVILIHSRFLAFERRRIEKDLVSRLGPDAPNRPKRLIVVSTQVIEQSMDIDFDCMFSDIAPMDLLLQRAGRLHRHNRPSTARPAEFAQAVLHISGCAEPQYEKEPEVDPGTCLVYGASIILRTLRTLLEHGSTITSPDDVAPLVRATYADAPAYPAVWKTMWDDAEMAAALHADDQQQRAKTFLFPKPAKKALWSQKLGVLEAREENQGQAQVRDIEASLEVILIRTTDEGFRTVDFAPEFADQPLDFGAPLDDDLSRALARTTVSLPQWVLEGPLGEELLNALELDVFTEDEVYSLNRNKWLGGQLFLPVDQDLTAYLAGLTFTYSEDKGMDVKRSTPERDDE